MVGQNVYPARIRDRDRNIQVPEANLGLDGSARLAADGGHGGLQGLGAQLEAPRLKAGPSVPTERVQRPTTALTDNVRKG